MTQEIKKIAVIGAGKIAHSIGSALLKNGFDILCVVSRSASSAEELARKVNAPSFSDDYNIIPEEAQLVVIAVPDGIIPSAALALSQLKTSFRDKLFVHLSGSVDLSALQPLHLKGAMTGSVHIMQSFPSREAVDISGAYAALEFDDTEAGGLIRSVAGKLGLISFDITSKAKAFYHMSGVFASNFLVSDYYNASGVFEKSGAEPGMFYDVISPLTRSTLSNLAHGPASALSGPVDRGDVDTVCRHLEALNDKETALVRLSYISQSLSLLDMIEKQGKGLDEGQRKMRDLLMDHLVQTAGELKVKQ